MATIVAQLTFVNSAFAAGTTAGVTRCTLLSSGVPVATVNADAAGKAVFLSVAAGTYTVVSQLLDAAGNPVGSAVTSQSITVTAPPVTLSVPSFVSLTAS
jgi:hypothetical protein